MPDFTFPVRQGDGTLTGHGWGAHTFTGAALTSGAAPRTGEVVLDAAAARAAKAGVGDTVVLETATGRADFRVSGLAKTGPGDMAEGATGWFADAQASALAGHPGKADAIAVLAKDGADADALAAGVEKALMRLRRQGAHRGRSRRRGGPWTRVRQGDAHRARRLLRRDRRHGRRLHGVRHGRAVRRPAGPGVRAAARRRGHSAADPPRGRRGGAARRARRRSGRLPAGDRARPLVVRAVAGPRGRSGGRGPAHLLDPSGRRRRRGTADRAHHAAGPPGADPRRSGRGRRSPRRRWSHCGRV